MSARSIVTLAVIALVTLAVSTASTLVTPDMEVEKSVSSDGGITWHNADTPDTALQVQAGSDLYFKIEVENTGNVGLCNITLYDPYDPTACPVIESLSPGESSSCVMGPITAPEGCYFNSVRAEAYYDEGMRLQAFDLAKYCGSSPPPPPPPPPPGGEGCTPGFWKNIRKHRDRWPSPETRYLDFDIVFTVDAPVEATLEEALKLGGGGVNALMRHATAAWLNATSPDVGYPYAPLEVMGLVQSAFATGDYEAAKNLLEAANELGCPLN